MNDTMMRVLDAGFGHPRGLLGRLGGVLMAWGNGAQERWTAQQAGLGPGQRVLAVGPGLALRLAAARVGPGGQLWDRPAGFAELVRVLRPGGRLVVSVHRQVLPVGPAELADEARDAGLAEVQAGIHPRQRNEPKAELLAIRP